MSVLILFSHLSSTCSFVALFFAVYMCPCLALDRTYGYPIPLLWGFLLILFLLSL